MSNNIQKRFYPGGPKLPQNNGIVNKSSETKELNKSQSGLPQTPYLLDPKDMPSLTNPVFDKFAAQDYVPVIPSQAPQQHQPSVPFNKTTAEIKNQIQEATAHKNYKPSSSTSAPTITTPNSPQPSSENPQAIVTSIFNQPQNNIGVGAGIKASLNHKNMPGDNNKVSITSTSQTTTQTSTTTTSSQDSSPQNIPTPPPMPKTKAPDTVKKDTPSHLEMIKKMGENILDGENIKPHNIPAEYKTNSGKPLKTIITATTTAKQVSVEFIIEEMKKREFLSEDLGKTITSIQMKDGTIANIGESKNSLKLNALGQAYAKQCEPKLNPECKIHDLGEKPTFIIVAPPTNSDNLLIETGKQKHLLVAFNTTTNEYFAIGYLTSKASGIFIHDKQVKLFQDEKENGSPKIPVKKQYLAKFDNPVKIENQDIQRIRWEGEYFDSLSNDIKISLIEIWSTVKQNPYSFFNKNGITKEIGLKMCQKHDENLKNKAKHPMTEDQLKQQEDAKLKQQQKQQEKNKFKQTTQHDETLSNDS